MSCPRMAVLLLTLALAVLPPGATAARAAEAVVLRTRHSPHEVQSLCVSDGRLLARTAAGRQWSVSQEQLDAASSEPERPLMVRWQEADDRAPGCVDPQPAALERRSVSGFQVTAQAVFRGRRYLGTFGGGLFDDAGQQIATTPDDIRALLVLSDRLLLGHAGGLALFDGTVLRPLHLAGPPAATITALAETGDTRWLGTFDAGLFRSQGDRNSWQRVEGWDHRRGRWINSLCWDGNELWVGSGAGLGRWNRDSDIIEPVAGITDAVQAVHCQASSLVVATSDAVFLEQEQGWQRIDLPKEALHTALLAGNDRLAGLWAAGLRGILHRQGECWRRYSELNGALPDSWVTALLPVAGTLWAGTYDAGIVRLDRAGGWQELEPDAWVNPNAMVAVAGGVAVGTMGDGLLLYHARTGARQRLTTADGLPSDNVTALLADGDTLWVGTDAGTAEVGIQVAASGKTLSPGK